MPNNTELLALRAENAKLRKENAKLKKALKNEKDHFNKYKSIVMQYGIHTITNRLYHD